MAFGTVFRPFARSGAELHMAANTLLMKGIGFFGKLGIFHISGIMTLQTTVGNLPFFGIGGVALAAGGQCFIVSGRMVMAVETVKGISIGGSVRLMVEKDFAGIGLVHLTDGLFRRFDRKGGIAYDGNQ